MRRRRGRRRSRQNRKKRRPRVKPYQPNAFEKIMASLEESFVSPPSGFYPAFGSIYPGGGFTFGAGYRHFYGRSAVWNVQGLYSLKNYKQVEVGTQHPVARREGASATNSRGDGSTLLRSATTGSAWATGWAGRITVCRTVTRRSRGACVQPGGRVWQGEVGFDGIDTGEGSGRHPSIETRATTRSPRLVSVRRRPSSARRAWRRSIRGRHQPTPPRGASTASGSQITPTPGRLLIPAAHGRSYPACAAPARQLGDFPARPRESILDENDAVPYYPAAPDRKRQHAARLPDGAIPRPPQPADLSRIPLDPEPPRSRHGDFLRCRQGGAGVQRARLQRPREQLGLRRKVSHALGHDSAARSGASKDWKAGA